MEKHRETATINAKSTTAGIFIALILLGGLASPLAAQSMEPMQVAIQKKKYKQCTANTVFIDKETEEESDAHLSRKWSFNVAGQVKDYQRYNNKQELEIEGKNSYDSQGRLSLTEENNLHIKEKERVEYAYNEASQLVSITDYRDEKLLVTYMHYYSNGKRDSTVWLDKHNNPELIEYYAYNDKGQLLELKENTMGRSDGRTIFEYREDGSLKDEILYDGFGNIFERMFYDEEGMLVKREVSYIDYSITYEYEYKKGLIKTMTKAFSNKTSYEHTEFNWSKRVE